MTKQLEALIAEMKAAAEKATQGEWWSDVVETGGTHGNGDDCIEGFHSYAVYDQNNHSLLDMTNSTAACITVEDDGDYCMAWDEVAQRNAEHITASCPPNVLALIAALEQAQQSEEVAELLRDKVKRLESDIWDSQQLVRVKSENQYELECKVRELEERNDKSNTAWSRREDAALEKLEATEKRIAELEAGPLAVKLPAVPEGWVMVPTQTTAEMISSGISAHYDRSKIQIHDRPAAGPMECAYAAMIAAAPKPK